MAFSKTKSSSRPSFKLRPAVHKLCIPLLYSVSFITLVAHVLSFPKVFAGIAFVVTLLSATNYIAAPCLNA